MGTKKGISKDNLRVSIAKNLKKTRTTFDPNMTQQHVAEFFTPPLSRAAIAQWEVGESLPDIDRLAVLSKAYGVTIDSLVFGDNHLDETLTPEAAKLARIWMSLPKKKRDLVLSLVETIKELKERSSHL